MPLLIKFYCFINNITELTKLFSNNAVDHFFQCIMYVIICSAWYRRYIQKYLSLIKKDQKNFGLWKVIIFQDWQIISVQFAWNCKIHAKILGTKISFTFFVYLCGSEWNIVGNIVAHRISGYGRKKDATYRRSFLICRSGNY